MLIPLRVRLRSERALDETLQNAYGLDYICIKTSLFTVYTRYCYMYFIYLIVNSRFFIFKIYIYLYIGAGRRYRIRKTNN